MRYAYVKSVSKHIGTDGTAAAFHISIPSHTMRDVRPKPIILPFLPDTTEGFGHELHD